MVLRDIRASRGWWSTGARWIPRGGPGHDRHVGVALVHGAAIDRVSVRRPVAARTWVGRTPVRDASVRRRPRSLGVGVRGRADSGRVRRRDVGTMKRATAVVLLT